MRSLPSYTGCPEDPQRCCPWCSRSCSSCCQPGTPPEPQLLPHLPLREPAGCSRRSPHCRRDPSRNRFRLRLSGTHSRNAPDRRHKASSFCCRYGHVPAEPHRYHSCQTQESAGFLRSYRPCRSDPVRNHRYPDGWSPLSRWRKDRMRLLPESFRHARQRCSCWCSER